MKTIGVLGSGAMGSGIAQVAATAGHEVYLYDNNPQALDRSRAQLAKILNRLVEKGRLTDAELRAITGRIFYVESLFDFKSADLVIEAIVEDLTVKKSVFEQLEDVVGPDCILATNTSSLPVTAIAAACHRPGRVIGIHFFNPAPLMQLVEIIPAVQTAPATLDRSRQLIENMGKLVVVAKDTPGFIVNRVARPFYGEALRIYEEGLADPATIDWAMTTLGGFRMGPFALMDYIGHDVNYKVTETVFAAFYYDPRYRPAFAQKRLVEAGYLGRKSGRGFYAYGDGVERPAPTEDTALGQRIVDRIVAMLINEAADALYLHIASRDDIDLAMHRGVNYPKGLLRWADELGLSTVVDRLDTLRTTYHEDRYRCSPLLRALAERGETFCPPSEG